jgi:hypothetical protein
MAVKAHMHPCFTLIPGYLMEDPCMDVIMLRMAVGNISNSHFILKYIRLGNIKLDDKYKVIGEQCDVRSHGNRLGGSEAEKQLRILTISI